MEEKEGGMTEKKKKKKRGFSSSKLLRCEDAGFNFNVTLEKQWKRIENCCMKSIWMECLLFNFYIFETCKAEKGS